jgi:peptidoglycan-N-acetylglucosamine deacetylase
MSLFHRKPARTEREQLRRRWVRQTILGIATLLVTPLPILAYMTHTADGYLMYLKARYNLLAPSTATLPADQLRVADAERSQPSYGVPVLVYHGIGRSQTDTADRRFVISRDHFAWQMRALAAAGYHAITSQQLASYLASNDATTLPSKPILITFDDGREDAMLQADPILKDTGMKATMFVIGADAGSGSFYYADWGALAGYAGNGRWELGNHTDTLHHTQTVAGAPLSDLVHTKPGETLGTYQRRVAADLASDTRLIDEHTSTYPVAFAYPYGDWGQAAEPGVADALNRTLRDQFKLAFDQDGQSGWRAAMPGDDAMHIHRLEVTDMTGAQLLRRLAAANALSRTVYEERGLGSDISPAQIVSAASAYHCPSGDPIAASSLAVAKHRPKKLVAVTFDGGPSAYTAQMLDVLDQADAHASFFVVGDELAGKQRLLQRMVISGDEIGDGTWSGGSLADSSSEAVRSSLAQTQAAVKAAAAVTPCFARAPYGLDRSRFARVAATLGLGEAGWSVDPSDYKTADPALIARRVLQAVSPGAIVILHDGGSERWPTVQALPRIIAGLHARGYRLVTVSELLADQGR